MPTTDTTRDERRHYPVKLDVAENGFGRLLIGDLNISNSVKAVEFEFPAGRAPRLVITLMPGSLDVSAAAALLDVDEGTRATLVELGWTPPPAESSRGGES